MTPGEFLEVAVIDVEEQDERELHEVEIGAEDADEERDLLVEF